MPRSIAIGFALAALGTSLIAPPARGDPPGPAPKLPLPPVATPPGAGRLTLDPGESFVAQNALMTNLPTLFNGLHLNNFLGADRFYAAGITGQGTTVYNVEAGHIWNTHVTLSHVLDLTTGTGALGEFDRHATWVGMVLGGRKYPVNPRDHQTGIASDADLRSAAIATSWNPSPSGPPRFSLSFNVTGASLFSAYQAASAAAADVVNSSWGFNDASGSQPRTVGIDGLARANPRTTFVASAGNAGPNANTVGGFASGYNAIAVANLANANSFDAVNTGSSRGPQDYSDPVRGLVPGARAPVDIAAPGTNITSAYYGGETGGNSPLLGGTPGGDPGSPTFYSGNVTGTSFAAPMVAGAAALLDSASYNTPALAANPNSRDSRVIKSVLLNAATKTPGWDNGQSALAGVVTTDRGLDYAVGAGRLNIAAAHDQYLAGTTDLDGAVGGPVEEIGWDLGAVGPATVRDYVIADALRGGTTLTATLSWFRDRTFTSATAVSDNAFRDLDLEVWDATFTTLVAQSRSRYDNVEHLAFPLPSDGQYGLRVRYFDTVFGPAAEETYALAWAGTPIPEPAPPAALLLPAVALLGRRRPGAAAAA